MMDSNPEHRKADRSRAVLLRDAALARVRLTRRWMIAGAAALTAGFAALVSAVAPGRSLSPSAKNSSARAAVPTPTTGTALPKMPAPASAGDLGLQSPAQGPTPDQSQPSQPSQPSQASRPAQPQSQPQSQSPSQTQPQPQSLPPAPPSGGVVSGGS